MEILVNAPVTADEINALLKICWSGHQDSDYRSILGKSLAWVTAREEGRLIGFFNLD